MTSLSARLRSLAGPSSTVTSARAPSHFTSCAQRPSSAGSGPAVASIGDRCLGDGALMSPSLHDHPVG